MVGRWLFHPESPGVRVFVVRSYWGWKIKPKSFAPFEEVALYQEFAKGMKCKEIQ